MLRKILTEKAPFLGKGTTSPAKPLPLNVFEMVAQRSLAKHKGHAPGPFAMRLEDTHDGLEALARRPGETGRKIPPRSRS